jgi:hypothetical protein
MMHGGRQGYIVATGIQTEMIACAVVSERVVEKRKKEKERRWRARSRDLITCRYLFQDDKSLFMFPYPNKYLALDVILFTNMVQFGFACMDFLFSSVCLFVLLFVLLFVCSLFVLLFVRSFICLFIGLSVRSFVRFLVRSFVCSLFIVHSLIHSNSLTLHSLIHSFKVIFDVATLYAAQRYLKLPILDTWRDMWQKKYRFCSFLIYGLVLWVLWVSLHSYPPSPPLPFMFFMVDFPLGFKVPRLLSTFSPPYPSLLLLLPIPSCSLW